MPFDDNLTWNWRGHTSTMSWRRSSQCRSQCQHSDRERRRNSTTLTSSCITSRRMTRSTASSRVRWPWWPWLWRTRISSWSSTHSIRLVQRSRASDAQEAADAKATSSTSFSSEMHAIGTVTTMRPAHPRPSSTSPPPMTAREQTLTGRVGHQRRRHFVSHVG